MDNKWQYSNITTYLFLHKEADYIKILISNANIQCL